jgi:hypothetical protein
MKINIKHRTLNLLFYETQKKKIQGKNLLFNRIKILENKHSKKSGLFFLIRQRIGFSFSRSFRSSLTFGLAQIINYFTLEGSRIFFFELNYETKEQITKDFVLYARSFLKNCIRKKDMTIEQRMMIIIPNQTYFIRFLKFFFIFSRSKIFEPDQKTKKEFFLEKDLKRIKYGKMLKPSDCRKYISEGSNDLIQIGGFLEEKKFKISREVEKCDINFFSPLAIRKLSPGFFEKLIFSTQICFIDNFEVLVMQNIENLLSLFRYLFAEKNLYKVELAFSLQTKKKFSPFQVFLISLSPLLEKMKILKNLDLARFLFPFQFSKSRKFQNFSYPKLVYLNFITEKNKVGRNQRLVFFKKKFFPILSSQKKSGFLIFTQTYSEYASIRNFFLENEAFYGISFLCFSEYISFGELKKKRDLIGKVNNQLILITERFYFFYRYSINETPIIVFYSLPMNRELYFELINGRKRKCLPRTAFIFFHVTEVSHLERISLEKPSEE